MGENISPFKSCHKCKVSMVRHLTIEFLKVKITDADMNTVLFHLCNDCYNKTVDFLQTRN
jgi:hypothetical protein